MILMTGLASPWQNLASTEVFLVSQTTIDQCRTSNTQTLTRKCDVLFVAGYVLPGRCFHRGTQRERISIDSDPTLLPRSRQYEIRQGTHCFLVNECSCRLKGHQSRKVVARVSSNPSVIGHIFCKRYSKCTLDATSLVVI